MKKSQIILGTLALLSMGLHSCSSEESLPSDNKTVDGEKYMAFTITTSGMGTRSDPENPEFENAQGDYEGNISADNLYFLFFDDNNEPFPLKESNNVNGTVITDGTNTTNIVKPSTINKNETNGSTTTVTGTLVLGKPTDQAYVGETPSKVLCIANITEEDLANLKNENLSDVLDSSTKSKITTTSFLMTSSTYYDGNNVITATDIKDKFKDSPDEATQYPAILYIERLVAKIRVTYNNSFNVKKRISDTETEDNGNYSLDGNDVSFTAEINGWQLRNTAEKTYMFKKLTPTEYTNWEWGWNDKDKHRSYWAEQLINNLTFSQTEYDLNNSTNFTNSSYNVSNTTSNIQYCYENTGSKDDKASDRTSDATAIVVKATIKKDGEPINMLRYAGSYYTYETLRQKVAETYNNQKQEGDATATAENVFFVYNGKQDNKYHAVVKFGEENKVNMSSVYGNLLWWKDGVTSYYINIEHLGGLTGVVRNHIYDYTLDGVVGLGIPGNDPVNPEDETFLACHVNILNWHVVSNKVTLE